MNKKTATIKIEPETRDRLGKLGTISETYDNVINALIDLWTNPYTVVLSELNYYNIVDIGQHYGSTLNEMIAWLLEEYGRRDEEIAKLGGYGPIEKED